MVFGNKAGELRVVVVVVDVDVGDVRSEKSVHKKKKGGQQVCVYENPGVAYHV